MNVVSGVIAKVTAVLIAALVWLSSLHVLLGRSPDALAGALERRQLALWSPGGAHLRDDLHASNPEWELMRRTFNVLAFGNLALARPQSRVELLAAIDRVLDDTLEQERRRGQFHYLMAYAQPGRFRDPRARSLFVDGEFALMLATRYLIEPTPRWKPVLEARVASVVGQLTQGPILAGESYPDEGWTFCNVVALVALRLNDAASGQDHRALIARWLASARAHLVDAKTGLLVSSFTWNGRVKDGPEGSTLWLVAPFLQFLDRQMASDQYQRTKRELARQVLGFGWAREWPASWPGGDDVDSGPTVPFVEANAGSSGLALVAARAFGDEDFLRGLVASLELAGFPVDHRGHRRYAAGNDLADAVILYALVQGPLAERAHSAWRRP